MRLRKIKHEDGLKELKKIDNVSELKRLAADHLECAILLNYNLLSRKSIDYTGSKFYIMNYIDSSSETMNEEELIESNIGKALKKGKLVMEV